MRAITNTLVSMGCWWKPVRTTRTGMDPRWGGQLPIRTCWWNSGELRTNSLQGWVILGELWPAGQLQVNVGHLRGNSARCGLESNTRWSNPRPAGQIRLKSDRLWGIFGHVSPAVAAHRRAPSCMRAELAPTGGLWRGGGLG